MLNKLKNKFILINMLTVGIVLLLIVVAITVITYNQEIEFAKIAVGEQARDRIIMVPMYSSKPKPEIPENLTPKNNPISRAYTIDAYIDKNGEVVCFASYLGGYSSEEFASLIKKIGALEENKGTAHGVIYAKRKITYTNDTSLDFEYNVVISPLSIIYRQVQGIFLIGLSVVLGAMCIFYFISRKLADVAVKPTEEAWKQQKRFIADASHDLKTPLTVIMANNDIMLSHPNSIVAEQKKWLESTKAEGEYMQALINKMLELARSEALASTIKLENTNISELVEKTALQLEPVAYEKNVEIKSEITSNLVIKSNSEEFTRLIYILVDNAIKYAKEGSRITISLCNTKKVIALDINNSGNVISKEELPHIFERFYRSDSARTSGGFGLGLSIAKNIVTALNGEISATSTKENGTTFTVKLK